MTPAQLTRARLRNPFFIEGPALISFSGGRTSGYMLRRILDAGIGSDVHVAFANTGKERPETLDFVRDCGERWGVHINWLEWRPDGFDEVDHATAARDGQPFAQLIQLRKFLPNPVTRFCTSELKIRVIKKFMLSRGHEHWDSIVGIRADEPSRIVRMRTPNKERWTNLLPLADAGVGLPEVTAFWASQPFDLQLRPWEGNCDLCFLKGRKRKERVMRDRPDLAQWWIDQEARNGATFRADAPRYSELLEVAQQPGFDFLDAPNLDDLGDCVCHD